MTKKKKLVYSKDQVIKDLYIGMCLKDLTISGRIYKEISRSWFGKLKTKYTYTISVPFIEKPFYNGEYNTNRILKVYSIQMEQHLIDKVEKLKENE